MTDAGAAGAGPRILYVNAAQERLCGHAAADLLGRSPGMFQGAGTDREAVGGLAALLRAGRGADARLVNYTRAGQAFLCAMRILPLRDHRGRVTQFVSLQRVAQQGPQGVAAVAAPEEGAATGALTGPWLARLRAVSETLEGAPALRRGRRRGRASGAGLPRGDHLG